MTSAARGAHLSFATPRMTQGSPVGAVELKSSLSLDELLQRLRSYSQEWRESKLPAGARRSGVQRCTLRIVDTAIEVQLEPQGCGPHFVWRGHVWRDPRDGTSRLRVSARLVFCSKVAYAVAVALPLVLFWLSPDLGRVPGDRSGAGEACMLSVFIAVTGSIMIAVRSSQQAPFATRSSGEHSTLRRRPAKSIQFASSGLVHGRERSRIGSLALARQSRGDCPVRCSLE